RGPAARGPGEDGGLHGRGDRGPPGLHAAHRGPQAGAGPQEVGESGWTMSAAVPADNDSLPLSAAWHVNQVCNRFEAECRDGQRPRIEDFLAEAGEPGRPALLRELLHLEVYYRRRAGEDPRPADYQARFPALDPAWLASALTEAAAAAGPPAAGGG